ncbi:MAG: hypothetical protein ABH858_00635 [Candidatus Omnitrophota bacterium]
METLTDTTSFTCIGIWLVILVIYIVSNLFYSKQRDNLCGYVSKEHPKYWESIPKKHLLVNYPHINWSFFLSNGQFPDEKSQNQFLATKFLLIINLLSAILLVLSLLVLAVVFWLKKGQLPAPLTKESIHS